MKLIRTLGISALTLSMFALVYVVLEPSISSAVGSQFTETLSVTSEISFLTPASNITLSPAIAGLTGGEANGATQVVVLTNNASGYNMTLTASSSVGMLGNAQGGNIPAYVPTVDGTPDFAFSTPANKARFGYTVEASTTADLVAAFKDNGSDTCGGANVTDTANSCWLNASSSAFQIINRSSETLDSGATTTIKFRAVISANPSPAIPQDTYVATTTLTAVVNP